MSVAEGLPRRKHLARLIERCIERARKFVENSKEDSDMRLSWLKSADFEIEKANKWLLELRHLQPNPKKIERPVEWPPPY